jgi:hypothetical protein
VEIYLILFGTEKIQISERKQTYLETNPKLHAEQPKYSSMSPEQNAEQNHNTDFLKYDKVKIFVIAWDVFELLTEFLLENVKGRDHLRDLDINAMIILKSSLKRGNMRM